MWVWETQGANEEDRGRYERPHCRPFCIDTRAQFVHKALGTCAPTRYFTPAGD